VVSAGAVALCWAQFAPYHLDRLEAAAARLGGARPVVGIETARASAAYAWAPASVPAGAAYRHVTLVPDRPLEAVGEAERLRRLLAALTAVEAQTVALCNYDRPHVLAAAAWLRARGRQVLLMADAKADDRPRRPWRERAKRPWLAPYRGALVSGARSRAYLTGLGLPSHRVVEGYDTLAVARLRRLADAPPAPAGRPHDRRGFLAVARFLPRKNLDRALAAYARYRALSAAAGLPARPFLLVGDGPERPTLQAWVGRARLPGVRFAGFLQADGVARALAEALALLVPAEREPWGLAVNEAVALGVPVLAAPGVGAVDALVRDGVSGAVLPPADTEAWAQTMLRLARDPAYWRRQAAASAALGPRADVARFAEGLETLLEGRS
jgi:glycosyltransferase involved in cell wall biosynthesis